MSGVVPEQRFLRLMEYLDEGWAIDPPVFVRPVWHTLPRAQNAYHFILKRADALHLLVVPTSPEVEQLVQARQLPLNRL